MEQYFVFHFAFLVNFHQTCESCTSIPGAHPQPWVREVEEDSCHTHCRTFQIKNDDIEEIALGVIGTV